MSEPVDPFELLRELNPVDPEDVADASSATEAQRALDEILAGSRSPQPSQRRPATSHPRRPRLRARAYLVASVGVAAALVAAVWVLTLNPAKRLTVRCFGSASLGARAVIVPAGHGSPTAACRPLWSGTTFGHRPTPSLQACILPSGGIGVFPGRNGAVCQRLGLPVLERTTTSPASH